MTAPDATGVSHHLLKAQTIHNQIRHQRDILLEALEMLLTEFPPVCTHPIGAPNSVARAVQDQQKTAVLVAKRAIAITRDALRPQKTAGEIYRDAIKRCQERQADE